jgi:simple sugar transport system ATP-binding protein
MTAPALQLEGIRKRFGSVQALHGADFTLMAGETHALLGENGAGKTTLMHVAYGLVRPDAGSVRIGGHSVGVHSPLNARRFGLGMVHQHFTAIPAFTVAENVALAAGWPVAPGPLERRVGELCERVGLPLEPMARAGRLSVGLKQRLEIVKALAADARVLLLDEPTAVLAPGEVEELLRVVRRFTSEGGSAVFITHKLDEALDAADWVTVLRRGSVVGTGPAAEWDAGTLAAAMLGSRDHAPAASRPKRADSARAETEAAVLVRGEGLEVPRESGYGLAVRNVSLAIRAGEIVGLAGVEGNGQRELLRVVAGRLKPLRGRLEVARPVGFIPEDRTTEGLIPGLSLVENVVLGSRADDPWVVGRLVDWTGARAATAELIRRYGVTASGPDMPAAALSGGNQQKLVLGRELSRSPAVVVAENPTRGLDIRAAEEVHGRLREAAAGGAAVLVYSSDLDEVLALADRTLVTSRGALLDPGPGASRAAIGALMLSGGR